MTTAWPRTILHADMDAFYAAVEQRDNPELRGKPIIVAYDGARSVVTTASYEARPFGVGSAMPLAVAKRKCPQAIVVNPRMSAYVAASAEIFEIFRTFTPLVEGLSLDEAFLDLTGTEKLWGAVAQAAAKLKDQVWLQVGLRVSVGAAACKFVAKVASDLCKPDALVVVPPDETLRFLAPLPVSRLWGVGAKSLPKLHELGLRTMADVAAADPAWLQQAFGVQGPHWWRLAQGLDERSVVADRGAHSVSAERTLAEDVRGRAAILPHLRESADEVALRLRQAGLVAGGMRVKLKTSDFRILTHQGQFVEPTSSARSMLELAERLLPQFDMKLAYRLVGLGATDLRDASAPVQGDLFAAPVTARDQRLDRAVDAINAKFGKGVVRRGSDLPGR